MSAPKPRRPSVTEEVFGPVVFDTDFVSNGVCACGENRPHVHDVSKVRDIQEWYRTGELPK